MSSNYDMTPYDASREQDFWSDAPAAPVANVPVASGKPRRSRSQDPMERLRRLLRGRTTLAITLAIVGALVGAAIGWMSQDKLYQASGLIRIPPNIPSLEKSNEVLPAYRQFMQSEAQYIRDLRLAEFAMKRPEWQEGVKESIKESMGPAAFSLATEAKFTDQDQYIRINFNHPDPETALAGAKAVIAAYAEEFQRERSRLDKSKVEAIERQIHAMEKQLAEVEVETEQLQNKYGTSTLAQEQANLQAERTRLQDEQFRLTRALEQAVRQQEAVKTNPELLAPLDMAVFDPRLNQLFELRNQAQSELRRMRLLEERGPRDPAVTKWEGEIKDLDTQIEERAKFVRTLYFGMVPNLDSDAGELVHVTPAYIRTLEDRLAATNLKLEDVAASLSEVSSDAVRLALLEKSALRQREQIALANERLDIERQNSVFQGEVGTITVWPPLDGTVRVAVDKRPTMALGGAIMGFAVPVALVLALGLLDSRFRYSDDAAEAGDRATLLGILPNLPDRLSDPNQASIAAHCVHQIRTMLQINHGSDESRAFAVTSAQRGDGKTSLALALGLSYAASGARTLLVDTDLQHGGLSSRLGVTGDDGIMDALTGGELMDVVCETDVTDLALLPIGRAAANHAGAFSPAAVRHLLDQAKRHYDVIICDTGPILGSIESTPIATSVDGVLLAVSRGQSRPLVTKALRHLESVNATLAGLVFNRAGAADFERSVSGMNLRNGVARLPGVRTNGRTVLNQN